MNASYGYEWKRVGFSSISNGDTAPASYKYNNFDTNMWKRNNKNKFRSQHKFQSHITTDYPCFNCGRHKCRLSSCSEPKESCRIEENLKYLCKDRGIRKRSWCNVNIHLVFSPPNIGSVTPRAEEKVLTLKNFMSAQTAPTVASRSEL